MMTEDMVLKDGVCSFCPHNSGEELVLIVWPANLTEKVAICPYHASLFLGAFRQNSKVQIIEN